MVNRISKRAEVRIPISNATRVALKSYQRSREPYDVLIRRLLISGIPRPLEGLTVEERNWVLIQNEGWQYPESNWKTNK